MLNKEPESIVRVDFQDCDPFGHLNNIKYIQYIMNARTQHLRSAYDLDIYTHLQKEGKSWLVVKSQIAYNHPAKYNEEVYIKTRLLYADKYRVIPEALMYSLDKKYLHAILWVEFMYVDAKLGRPVKHDEKLMELFNQIRISNEKITDLNFDMKVKEIQREFKLSSKLETA